jgi:hypothetical protein
MIRSERLSQARHGAQNIKGYLGIPYKLRRPYVRFGPLVAFLYVRYQCNISVSERVKRYLNKKKATRLVTQDKETFEVLSYRHI